MSSGAARFLLSLPSPSVLADSSGIAGCSTLVLFGHKLMTDFLIDDNWVCCYVKSYFLNLLIALSILFLNAVSSSLGQTNERKRSFCIVNISSVKVNH